MSATAPPPVDGEDRESDDRSAPSIRPQTHVLMFCGIHLVDPSSAVATTALIDVLSRSGLGEHAARSTVSRMVRRGTLQRRRVGKRSVLFPAPSTRAVLLKGGERAWQSPVNRAWDGQWTLLGFSLPESRRPERHLLRSRLEWSGFGLLQNGLWVAPRRIDVAELLGPLDVLEHVKVFRAEVAAPTQVAELIDDAWDLAGIARGYQHFLRRWDRPDPLPDAPDDLARQLWLLGEWTSLARHDPGLPLEYLPADWPAVRAEHVALRLRARIETGAATIAAGLVQRLDTTGGDRH